MFQKQENKEELRYFSAAFTHNFSALKTGQASKPATIGVQQYRGADRPPTVRLQSSRIAEREEQRAQVPAMSLGNSSNLDYSRIGSSASLKGTNKFMTMHSNLGTPVFQSKPALKPNTRFNNPQMLSNQAPLRAGPLRMAVSDEPVEEGKLPEVQGGSIQVVDDYLDDQFSGAKPKTSFWGRNKFKVEEIQGGTLRLKAGNKTVLVDPNLNLEVSPLTAGDVTKDKFAAIVISRASPDLCHIETLKQVDKSIKIIGNSKVCKICRKLGFKDLQELTPQKVCKFGELEIVAFPGPKIGTWSKQQNGYVFSYEGESMLYEPSGDVTGLKDYKKSFKDRPITSAIVPMLSQIMESKEKLIPAKIDQYVKNKEYNKMIKRIRRQAPDIERIYVRTRDSGSEAGTLKNGVTLLKLQTERRSQSAPKSVGSETLLNEHNTQQDNEQEWMSAPNYSDAVEYDQMIAEILKQDNPDPELLEAIEAQKKWQRVRIRREEYEKLLNGDITEEEFVMNNGAIDKEELLGVKSPYEGKNVIIYPKEMRKTPPKPEDYKWVTPAMQKMLEKGAGHLKEDKEPEEEIVDRTKWLPYKYLAEKQSGWKGVPYRNDERQKTMLEALAEMPSDDWTKPPKKYEMPTDPEEIAALKKKDIEEFWEYIAKQKGEDREQTPDELEFYKVFEQEINEAVAAKNSPPYKPSARALETKTQLAKSTWKYVQADDQVKANVLKAVKQSSKSPQNDTENLKENALKAVNQNQEKNLASVLGNTNSRKEEDEANEIGYCI